MGIEHIGEVASKSLALEFGLGVVDATFEEVVALDGIGEEMANSLLEFMRVNHDFVLKLFDVILEPVTSGEGLPASSTGLCSLISPINR